MTIPDTTPKSTRTAEVELLGPRDGKAIRKQLEAEAQQSWGRGWDNLSDHQKDAEIALRFVSWILAQRSPQFHDAQVAWIGGPVPRWS